MRYNKALAERDREIKRQRKIDEEIQERMSEIDRRIESRNAVMPIIQNIIWRKEHEELISKKDEVKNKLVGTLPYKLWIVCWDLLNDDYWQIQADIQRGKITHDEVLQVVEKMNSIHPIVDTEYVFV